MHENYYDEMKEAVRSAASRLERFMCDSRLSRYKREFSAFCAANGGVYYRVFTQDQAAALGDQPIMGVSTRIAQWARTTGIKSYTRLSVQSPTVLSHDLARIATKTVVPVTVVRGVLFFIAATVVERVDLTTDPVTWVAHDGHPVTDAGAQVDVVAPLDARTIGDMLRTRGFSQSYCLGSWEPSLWYAVFRDGDMDGAAAIAVMSIDGLIDNEFVDDNDMVAEPWDVQLPYIGQFSATSPALIAEAGTTWAQARGGMSPPALRPQ